MRLKIPNNYFRYVIKGLKKYYSKPINYGELNSVLNELLALESTRECQSG